MLPHIFGAQIFDDGAGFTNQMIAFVSAVIYCKRYNKNTLLVGNMLSEIKTDQTISISRVFDIDKFNHYLRNKLQIMLVDKNTPNFNILSVISNGQDITSHVLKNNCVYFISSFSAPYVVQYSLGSCVFTCNIQMSAQYPVFDFLSMLKVAKFPYTFAWLGSLEPPLFDEIFTNLYFHPHYYEKAAEFAFQNNIINTDRISVIHLRVESDTETFATKLKMTFNDYKRAQTQKYIENIQKHIPKTDKVIILSYLRDHPVVDYLRDNGYSVYFTEKTENGRELCAIVDLIVADLCNSVFLGYFNLETKSGSTFSYFISRRLAIHGSPTIKTVMFSP